MKRPTKLLLGMAAAVVAIVAVLAAVPRLVNLDRFLPRITSTAKDALGRDLKIKGIKLSLLTGLGVKLTGLEIESQPGFSSEPFVSVDEIEVKVGILPLLHKTIEVKRISLIRPKILLERNRQGELSISDLEKKFAKKEPAGQPQPKKQGLELAGRKLEIRGFSVKAGVLIFDDYQKSYPAPSTIQLNDFKLQVSSVSEKKPIKFEVSFCPEEECRTRDISLSGKIGPLGEDMNFKAAPLEANADLSSLKISSLMPFLGALPIEVLSGVLSGKAALKGNFASSEGNASLEVSDFSFIDAKKSWRPSPKTRISLQSQLKANFDEKTFIIDQATLATGKSVLELAGQVKGSTYQFAIKNGKLEMAEIAQLVPPLKKALDEKGAALSGQALLSGKFGSASPLSFNTTLDLKNAGLKWPGLLNKQAGENFLASISGKKAEAGYALDALNLDFPGGAIVGKGEISSNNNINLALNGNQIAIDQVASWLEPVRSLPVTGKMNLAGALRGNLNQTSDLEFKIDNLSIANPDMDIALQGNVQNFSEPKIRFDARGKKLDLDKVLASRPQTPAAPKPAPAAAGKQEESSLKKIDLEGRLNYGEVITSGYQFSNVQTNMTMKNGVLNLGDSKMGIFSGNVNGPVALNLAPTEPAFQGNINLADIVLPEALQKFTSLAKTLDGKFDGNFSFTGSGSGVDQIEKNLNGKGKFAIKAGNIKTLDLVGNLVGDWANSDQFRNLVQSHVGKKSWSTLNETKYELATGNFEVANSEVKISDLLMNVPEGQVKAKGKFDFNYKTKFDGDLVMNEKASNDFAKALGLGPDYKKFLFKDGKYLWLPFSVKGNYPKIQVKLVSEDYWKNAQEVMKKMAQDAAKKQAEDLQKQLQKQAKDQVDKLLKGLKP